MLVRPNCGVTGSGGSAGLLCARYPIFGKAWLLPAFDTVIGPKIGPWSLKLEFGSLEFGSLEFKIGPWSFLLETGTSATLQSGHYVTNHGG